MTEIWKDIPDYEGLYQVSSHGRIRSLTRVVWCETYYRECKGKVLSTAKAKGSKKYDNATLCNSYGKISIEVHVIVAKVFIGDRPDGHDVAHLDGDNRNNRSDNLAYKTRSENNIDITRQGKRKFTLNQISDIKNLRSTGMTYVDIAPMYDTYPVLIGQICRGRIYAGA